MNLKMYTVLVLLLFSCKRGDSEKKNSSKQDVFVISMKVKVLEDDVIEMFYKRKSEKEFTEVKKIRNVVLGSKNFQNIEFLIDKSEFPFEFRIDLGQSKRQKDIIIEEIILGHKNNSIIIKKEFLSTFFSINKYLSLNSESGIFTINELNGRRDPFIISKALLIKKMEIEL